MAQIKLQMTAHAVPGCEETCTGCLRKFTRGEQMSAMVYDDGESAGWHCPTCVETWSRDGESALPRWSDDTSEEPT